MASEYEKKGANIPRELKRSVRLSESERAEVIEIRRSGVSYEKIANAFGVSKSLIILICNPDIAERKRMQFKERQSGGRYYNKDKQRIYMRNHRSYKRELYESKLLTNQQNEHSKE